MWKLYEPYSHPLTRVVCGLPTSWEQSAASVGFPSGIKTIVWSPCSKFIAVAWSRSWYGGTVEILDGGTLGQLRILPLYKQSITRHLIFSPDTSMLTWIGRDSDWIVSWDVQTGVQVSAISTELLRDFWNPISATYSTCGTMIGLHSYDDSTSTISTYNILSGTHIYSHSVEKLKLKEICAHGECLRYAVVESRAITIWEVGFTSTHTPAKVESLSLPANFPYGGSYHFSPTFSRVVFFTNGTCHIWDTQCSKYLLDSTAVTAGGRCSFSADGHFLICKLNGEVHIWKESPTGYIFHQKVTSTDYSTLSPNGELFLTQGGSAAQLWHTTDSGIPHPTTSTNVSLWSPLLVFSPDKTLAAVAEWGDVVVTVVDLKSGIPRLIIDTDMEVYGMGVSGGTIVVFGCGDSMSANKIVTWNIPDGVPNLKANIDDSVKTVTVDGRPSSELYSAISVSPDLHHFIFEEPKELYLCDVLTGQQLTSAPKCLSGSAWFTQDGCGVWSHWEGWKIIKDGESNTIKLEYLGRTRCPPGERPWQCPPDYKVTDGWILHSSGKRLLWLPPQWWPGQYDRVWGGQFLALVNRKLPEVLILGLE